MKEKSRRYSERGQSLILVALLLVALMAMVGLAIDGGNSLYKRRVVQNAADASVLGGMQYVVATNSPIETTLLARINESVERNGIPDSDGIPGNEINDNVVVYYTDENGERLAGCSLLPCGSIPANTRGLEAVVSLDSNTFFISVLGIRSLVVGADAAAVVRGSTSGTVSPGALLALGGDCTEEDRAIDGSGSNSEILGGTHTNSYFYIGGQNNHFHGQVTYVNGSENGVNVYEPEAPQSADPVDDPFAEFSVADYGPGGSRVAGLTVYNLDTMFPSLGEVDDGKLKDAGLYNDSTKELKTGVYWSASKGIKLGNSDLHGTVTLVTGGHIFISGSNVNITAYTPDGMLMFSDHTPPNPCTDPAIDLSGSSGSVKPIVSHADGCPLVGDHCWTPSDMVFTGLIYAPRGKVFAAGSKSTMIGSVVAKGITLNGSDTLIVENSELFPAESSNLFLLR
jgi:hypothetical protein